MSGGITLVPGIKVGQVNDPVGLTGCTVILAEDGAVASVDVRGGAPGTRETDLLQPGRLVERIHAVVLAGGSAFGLDAAGGVVRYLEEKGIGFDVNVTKVPIVTAAVLFDLAIGDYRARPDAAMGYAACLAASGGPVLEGNVGAGTGATVGKFFGPEFAMKGGIGSAATTTEAGVIVGALVVVNSFGDVLDWETRKILAGTRDPATGLLASTSKLLQEGDLPRQHFFASNTTIGVVATNAFLTKSEAHKVAQMAHDGLAMSISPVHTMYDGDTIFALSTGNKTSDVNVIGVVAAHTLAEAVKRAILAAEGIGGIPAHRDMKTGNVSGL